MQMNIIIPAASRSKEIAGSVFRNSLRSGEPHRPGCGRLDSCNFRNLVDYTIAIRLQVARFARYSGRFPGFSPPAGAVFGIFTACGAYFRDFGGLKAHFREFGQPLCYFIHKFRCIRGRPKAGFPQFSQPFSQNPCAAPLRASNLRHFSTQNCILCSKCG